MKCETGLYRQNAILVWFVLGVEIEVKQLLQREQAE